MSALKELKQELEHYLKNLEDGIFNKYHMFDGVSLATKEKVLAFIQLKDKKRNKRVTRSIENLLVQQKVNLQGEFSRYFLYDDPDTGEEGVRLSLTLRLSEHNTDVLVHLKEILRNADFAQTASEEFERNNPRPDDGIIYEIDHIIPVQLLVNLVMCLCCGLDKEVFLVRNSKGKLPQISRRSAALNGEYDAVVSALHTFVVPDADSGSYILVPDLVDIITPLINLQWLPKGENQKKSNILPDELDGVPIDNYLDDLRKFVRDNRF